MDFLIPPVAVGLTVGRRIRLPARIIALLQQEIQVRQSSVRGAWLCAANHTRWVRDAARRWKAGLGVPRVWPVKQYSPIDPQQFVSLVRDPLERHDTAALARLVQESWSHDQVMGLLDSADADARKLAAFALGMVGDTRSITALATCLRDRDPMVNQTAEHALWTIWFRCGSKLAQEAVLRGSSLLNNKEYQQSLEHFCTAIRLDPTYAEAYNQRAIAYYLLEDYHASIEDCEMAVQFMPCHFGAWSGMGHCFAHQGDTQRALRCYRRALGINPYLNCVREIITEIETGQCTISPDRVSRH